MPPAALMLAEQFGYNVLRDAVFTRPITHIGDCDYWPGSVLRWCGMHNNERRLESVCIFDVHMLLTSGGCASADSADYSFECVINSIVET